MKRGFKRTLKRAMVLTVCTTVVCGGLYGYYAYRMTHAVDSDLGDVQILLTDGADFDQATELLLFEGLIRDPTLFNLRARQREKRVALQAGHYQFTGQMTPDQIMDKLASGPDERLKDQPIRLLIAPGDHLFKLDVKLQQLRVPGDLLTLSRNHRTLEEIGASCPSERRPNSHTLLEGYLFPDTYHLDQENPDLLHTVTRASERFRTEWNTLKQQHRDSYRRLKREFSFEDHDFVILASLIEKEIIVRAEAPLVAGVFYNRLRRGQPLQTDPTMVYGPNIWQEKPAPSLRRNRNNPYNTYHFEGLPPGPICSPGRAALRAALSPGQTDAFYFVARQDGSGRHAFSKTLSEHRANINRYLR